MLPAKCWHTGNSSATSGCASSCHRAQVGMSKTFEGTTTPLPIRLKTTVRTTSRTSCLSKTGGLLRRRGQRQNWELGRCISCSLLQKMLRGTKIGVGIVLQRPPISSISVGRIAPKRSEPIVHAPQGSGSATTVFLTMSEGWNWRGHWLRSIQFFWPHLLNRIATLTLS